jgi:hypothetical protein
MFDVLKPVYVRDDVRSFREAPRENYRVEWEKVGEAEDIESAKQLHKAPVLAVKSSWEVVDGR